MQLNQSNDRTSVRGTAAPQPNLHLIGRSIYNALTQKRGWKKEARRKPTTAIDSHKLYTPSEVAALLNVSYDTAVRRMTKMGAVDMGTPERRYKRGKRLLRVSGAKLRVYLHSKEL